MNSLHSSRKVSAAPMNKGGNSASLRKNNFVSITPSKKHNAPTKFKSHSSKINAVAQKYTPSIIPRSIDLYQEDSSVDEGIDFQINSLNSKKETGSKSDEITDFDVKTSDINLNDIRKELVFDESKFDKYLIKRNIQSTLVASENILDPGNFLINLVLEINEIPHARFEKQDVWKLKNPNRKIDLERQII
jgi:hypothetical protein